MIIFLEKTDLRVSFGMGVILVMFHLEKAK